LRYVDSGARHVGLLIHVSHAIDRSAVNSHPELDLWIVFVRLVDFNRTPHRRIRGCQKNQGDAIAGGNGDEFPGRRGFLKLAGFANEIVQSLDKGGLLVQESLRITDDVDEENVADLKFAGIAIFP
jgi:hypothetical protein